VIEKKLAAQDVSVQPVAPTPPPPVTKTPAVVVATPAPAPAPTAPVANTNQTAEAFTVQVGVFGKLQNAEALVAQLKKKHSDVTLEKAVAGSVLYRVRIGYFTNIADARTFETQLVSEGFEKPGIVRTGAVPSTASTRNVPEGSDKAVVGASPLVQTPSPAAPAGAYTVQVGVFANLANAEALAARLQKDYDSVVIYKGTTGGTLYHVQVGRFSDMRTAREAEKQLAGQGLVTYVLKVE
jgi:cell division protein FtsN